MQLLRKKNNNLRLLCNHYCWDCNSLPKRAFSTYPGTSCYGHQFRHQDNLRLLFKEGPPLSPRQELTPQWSSQIIVATGDYNCNSKKLFALCETLACLARAASGRMSLLPSGAVLGHAGPFVYTALAQ
eukprot:2429411-Amphidinium_carterae.1